MKKVTASKAFTRVKVIEMKPLLEEQFNLQGGKAENKTHYSAREIGRIIQAKYGTEIYLDVVETAMVELTGNKAGSARDGRPERGWWITPKN